MRHTGKSDRVVAHLNVRFGPERQDYAMIVTDKEMTALYEWGLIEASPTHVLPRLYRLRRLVARITGPGKARSAKQ